MIESLHDDGTTYRQARAGLASLPGDLYQAKVSWHRPHIFLWPLPHIYHVVGYCEAHHAAKQDIIESCKIVRRL